MAEQIDAARDEIAGTATERLFQEHSDWADRWGERGRKHTRQDISFTLSFLASAIREGIPGIFADYVSWLRTVLEPRGVGTDVIEATHETLEAELVARLGDEGGRLVSETLGAGDDVLSEPLDLALEPDLEPDVEAMADALVQGDSQRAGEMVDEALSRGETPTEIGDELARPAMEEVGRRWQVDEISVADEHLATATLRKLLSDLYRKREFEEPGRGRVLLACVEGCLHSVGLEMVSDRFEEEGFEVRLLGADVPVEDLVEHAADWRPDGLGLSLSMPQHLATTRRTISRVREMLGDRAPMTLVGGRMARTFPRLHRALGADGSVETAAQAPRSLR